MRCIDLLNSKNHPLNSSDCLFHFTKRETAVEKILFSGKFKFGLFKDTNDPKEYREKFSGVAGFGLGKEKLKEALELKDAIDYTLIHCTGFLSFCQNTMHADGWIEENALFKPRMWSQYGDNHKGVCFVFSKLKLIEFIKANFSSEDYIFKDYPVAYDDYNSDIGAFLEVSTADLMESSLNDSVLRFIESNYREILFRKHSDYRDEAEFRVCFTCKHDKAKLDIFINLKEIIIAIIAGDNFHEAYTSKLKEYAKQYEIPLFSLQWLPNGYWLSEESTVLADIM